MRWRVVFAVICILVLVADFEFEPTRSASAAPTTFVVNSTADTGGTCPTTTTCTLRQAINSANTTGTATEVDRITFNIPGAGVKTISPATQLPPITQPVSIEGNTQPGSSCGPTRNLLIEIVNGGPATVGLLAAHVIASQNQQSTLRGMTVRGFSTYQVSLGRGSGHIVECMNIGTNAAGTAASGVAAFIGIYAAPASNGPTIGGDSANDRNIITNAETGVYVGSDFTDVLGNYIGLSANGSTPIPNNIGISIAADSVIIGGGNGNVISGNNLAGIAASGSSLAISQNTIGLSAARTAIAANGGNGIEISNSDSPTITGNFVGGNDDGIRLTGVSSAQVSFNAIGVDATGMLDLGNRQSGIVLDSTVDVEIGANGPNFIAGNGDYGILVSNGDGTIIQGNLIGLGVDNAVLIPNGLEAIFVTNGTLVTTIGGPDETFWNTIYSDSHGLSLSAAIWIEDGTGNTERIEIDGNSLRSDGHAINLAPATEGLNVTTPNDGPGDVDTGPNTLQNRPVLTAAFPGTSTIIEGSLESSEGSYRVRFYASSACDSGLARQAERYIGRITVNVDAGGIVEFSNTLFVEVAEGEFITATATDELGNTSELSPCREATNIVPSISGFNSDRVVAGTIERRLTIEGADFSEDTIVIWDDVEIVPSSWEPSSLLVTLTRDEIGWNAREVEVAVKNQAGTSEAATVFVVPSTSDVDCSGTADADDALTALKLLAGIDAGVTCSDDPDTLDGLTIADVLWIRQEVAGLIDFPFPLEEGPFLQ